MKQQLLLLSLVFALSSGSISAQNARDAILVGPTAPDSSAAPSMDNDGSLTVAIYQNEISGQVFAVTSDAFGLEFSTPVRIDDDATGALKVVQEWSCQVVGSTVVAAWSDGRNGGATDVQFTVSLDGGVTWSANQRVDVGVPAGEGFVRDWRLQVESGTTGLNVFFLINQEPDVDATEELFLVANDPTVGVGSLLPAVFVPTWAPQEFDVDNIGIDSIGDAVYVAWDDNRNGPDDTFIRISNDRGQSFSPEIQLDSDPSNPNSDTDGDAINVDAVGTTVAVAWHQENSGLGPEGLRVAVSVDAGVSFGVDVAVGEYIDGLDDVERQRIAIDVTDPSTIIVVWVDNRDGQNGVYTATSTDSGATWGPDTTLADDGNFPSLRTGLNGVAGIAFEAFNDVTNDAVIAYSLDSGDSWTSVVAEESEEEVSFPALIYSSASENFIITYLDDDSGVNEVYSSGFSVCGAASIVTRNGGTNPDALTSDPFVMGDDATATIDATLSGHSLTALVAVLSPLNFSFGGGQVLLVNIADPSGDILQLPAQAGPTATYEIEVPNDPALCDLTIYTQGLLIGTVTPFALTNSQDLTIGAFESE